MKRLTYGSHKIALSDNTDLGGIRRAVAGLLSTDPDKKTAWDRSKPWLKVIDRDGDSHALLVQPGVPIIVSEVADPQPSIH